jgi:hypothetical protein
MARKPQKRSKRKTPRSTTKQSHCPPSSIFWESKPHQAFRSSFRSSFPIFGIYYCSTVVAVLQVWYPHEKTSRYVTPTSGLSSPLCDGITKEDTLENPPNFDNQIPRCRSLRLGKLDTEYESDERTALFPSAHRAHKCVWSSTLPCHFFQFQGSKVTSLFNLVWICTFRLFDFCACFKGF